MELPNTPKGDARVALGAKTKEDEGFAVHRTGTHTESEYAELGNHPSQKKALKPHIHNLSPGGRNA